MIEQFRHYAWNASFDRNETHDTYLTEQGHSVTIYRQVVQHIKELVGYNNPPALVIASPKVCPKRLSIHNRLLARHADDKWQISVNPELSKMHNAIYRDVRDTYDPDLYDFVVLHREDVPTTI